MMDKPERYSVRREKCVWKDGYALATQEIPLLTAKDGKLIKMHDVFYGEDGKGWTIRALGDEYVWGECNGEYKRLKPEWLTSKKPDSWEQLEKDLTQAVLKCCSYGYSSEKCTEYTFCKDCRTDFATDIIRRAKALAGVE